MKKLLLLTLALIMVLSLAACGSKDDGGTSDTNNTPSNQSTSGGSSAAPQSGDKTNANDVWSDSDKQVATIEGTPSGADVTYTVWNGGHLRDGKGVEHPGDSTFNVDFTTTHSQEDVLYVPFVIEIYNPTDKNISTGITITPGFEGYYGYAVSASTPNEDYSTQTISVSGIKPGETVTYIGYFERPEMETSAGSKIHGGGAYVNVYFNEAGEIRNIGKSQK